MSEEYQKLLEETVLEYKERIKAQQLKIDELTDLLLIQAGLKQSELFLKAPVDPVISGKKPWDVRKRELEFKHKVMEQIDASQE